MELVLHQDTFVKVVDVSSDTYRQNKPENSWKKVKLFWKKAAKRFG